MRTSLAIFLPPRETEISVKDNGPFVAGAVSQGLSYWAKPRAVVNKVLVALLATNGTMTRPIGFKIDDDIVLSMRPPAGAPITDANIIFS